MWICTCPLYNWTYKRWWQSRSTQHSTSTVKLIEISDDVYTTWMSTHVCTTLLCTHWRHQLWGTGGTCPASTSKNLLFQFTLDWSYTKSHSNFVWFPLQTYLLTVLFCIILCVINNFHAVLCPSSRQILATPLSAFSVNGLNWFSDGISRTGNGIFFFVERVCKRCTMPTNRTQSLAIQQQ